MFHKTRGDQGFQVKVAKIWPRTIKNWRNLAVENLTNINMEDIN